MPRQPRWNLPPYGVYHVINRGVEKRTIYFDDADRLSFISLLRAAARRFDWTFHAYTLMTNHFHLVLQCELERLTKGMHLVGSRYAQGFNDRYERTGHLFQGRFSAFSVEGDDHFTAVCDYVLANPVRAGMCARWDEYRWSGCRI